MRVTFGLWKRTVKIDGEEATVFSGQLPGGYEMTLWPVKNRRGNKSPTHELVITEKRERREQDTGDQGGDDGGTAPF